MKQTIFITSLFAASICLLLNGCANGTVAKDALPEINSNTSNIIVRASNGESGALGPVVFTGDDILWYNETTKELRFKDNASHKPVVLNHTAIRFYLHNEYLFSSMIYVSGSHSQIINNLVFYYNMTENKYFLLDGYPDISELPLPPNANISDAGNPNDYYKYVNASRIENMQKIETEWDKFINQLKKERRYNN